MTTIAVKHYNFGMQGAPQLANAWGDMTALLDAVLVDGFNLRTIDTLTFADGIATARVNAGHLYLVDQVVLIEGANQTEYNGEVRVLSTTSLEFTSQVLRESSTPCGSKSARVLPTTFIARTLESSERPVEKTSWSLTSPLTPPWSRPPFSAVPLSIRGKSAQRHLAATSPRTSLLASKNS